MLLKSQIMALSADSLSHQGDVYPQTLVYQMVYTNLLSEYHQRVLGLTDETTRSILQAELVIMSALIKTVKTVKTVKTIV